VGIISFANKAKEAYKNRKIAEEKIFELNERKVKLENDLNELHTDLGKERVFRENYGLGRPGEKVIVVLDQAPSGESIGTPENPTRSGDSSIVALPSSIITRLSLLPEYSM
jgi:hypothetical protein